MIKNLPIKNIVFGLILAATAIPVPSAVAHPTSSCTSYIRGMFNGFPGDRYGKGHWFKDKGTRITARGRGGFSTIDMNKSYSSREG